MKLNKLHIFLGALVLFFVFLYLPAPKADLSALKNPPAGGPENLPPPQIEAKSALAEDLLTGEVLFSKNSDEILPLASLTKILSGLVVLDYVDLEDEIEITKFAISAPEPSSLKVGEGLKAKELLAMAMAESSNDAITALFEYASQKNNLARADSEPWFLDLMRKKTEALGAKSMNFNNITGYDISPTVSGGYGSAEDLLKIARTALASPIWQFGSIREVISKEGIKHVLKPTNELGPELSPLIGAKTGYTDLAGGNLLVIVEYPIGRPLGIVVLGSSVEGRFSDVKKILEWVKTKKMSN